MNDKILAVLIWSSIFLFMTLREWMDREGLTQARAAEALGIAQAEVCMYLKGRTPTLERALRFEAATKGAITAQDWVKSTTTGGA